MLICFSLQNQFFVGCSDLFPEEMICSKDCSYWIKWEGCEGDINNDTCGIPGKVKDYCRDSCHNCGT